MHYERFSPIDNCLKRLPTDTNHNIDRTGSACQKMKNPKIWEILAFKEERFQGSGLSGYFLKDSNTPAIPTVSD